MEKDHLSVAALWQEYDSGILGRQSLREMLAQDLKKPEAQRKRWERRRVVVYEVERLMKERTTSASSIVADLDKYMAKERLSMAKLQDRIAKARECDQTLPLW